MMTHASRRSCLDGHGRDHRAGGNVSDDGYAGLRDSFGVELARA
jgi:hypothetical protein